MFPVVFFTLHSIFGFVFICLCFVFVSFRFVLFCFSGLFSYSCFCFFLACFFAIYSGKLCLQPFFKLLWFIEECSEFVAPVTPELNIEPVSPVFVDLTLHEDEHVC